MFELTIKLRDHNGRPTGKTKTIVTDDASKLADFWAANQPRPKKGKKKRKDKGAASKTEADQVLKEMYTEEV